jgi:hypothetical protein
VRRDSTCESIRSLACLWGQSETLTTGFIQGINASHRSAANQAVAAKSYGLGAGTPIYYDMEAYNHTNAGCRTAVLAFLDAWTRQLKAVSYISGVYSSAGSAITDLQSNTTVAGHSLAEPQAIWFAQ